MTAKTKSDDNKPRNTTIESSDIWINKTRSGNGFIIVTKSPIPEGTVLLGGLNSLEEFIEGKRTGVNLGILVGDRE